jgi:hypothetical protein
MDQEPDQTRKHPGSSRTMFFFRTAAHGMQGFLEKHKIKASDFPLRRVAQPTLGGEDL